MSLPHVVIQFLAFMQTIFTSPCKGLDEFYFVKSMPTFFWYGRVLYKIAAFIMFR